MHVKDDVLLNELARLLHNYLAGIYTLIEHTRNIYRKITNDKSYLKKNYDDKLSILLKNRCIVFLKDLRQYIQHNKVPIFFYMTTLKKTSNIRMKNLDLYKSKDINYVRKHESNGQIILDKNYLLNWDKWSSVSKEYLNDSKKNINILKIIRKYQSLINDFYKWFLKRLSKTKLSF